MILLKSYRLSSLRNYHSFHLLHPIYPVYKSRWPASCTLSIVLRMTIYAHQHGSHEVLCSLHFFLLLTAFFAKLPSFLTTFSSHEHLQPHSNTLARSDHHYTTQPATSLFIARPITMKELKWKVALWQRYFTRSDWFLSGLDFP